MSPNSPPPSAELYTGGILYASQRIRNKLSYVAIVISLALGFLLVLNLQQSLALRQLNRSIIRAMPDGLIVCDEHGKVSIFNEAAQHLTGYSEADIARVGIDALIPADMLPLAVAWREDATIRLKATPSKPLPTDTALFPIVTAHGERVELQVRINGFSSNGDLWFVATLRDATANFVDLGKPVYTPASNP